MCISKVKWAINLNDSWKGSALAREVFVTEPPPWWSMPLKGFKTVTTLASLHIGCPDFLLSGFFNPHRTVVFTAAFESCIFFLQDATITNSVIGLR